VKVQDYNDTLEHVLKFFWSVMKGKTEQGIQSKDYICFQLSIVYMTRFRGEVSEGQRE
jgi:hypothetical protein